jgi:S1-C subfamily serine protease
MKQQFYWLLSLFVILPIQLNASNKLEYWKNYFDNRSGNLECYEGIFRVKMSVVNDATVKLCEVQNYQNPNFDTICIYSSNNEYLVYSLRYVKEIGKLRVKKSIKENYLPKNTYSEIVQVAFEGNGTKNYPSSDENFNQRMYPSQYKDVTIGSDNIFFGLTSIYFKHGDKYDILSKEILPQIDYRCYTDNKYNVSFSSFLLENLAYRIYPNEKEFPKISGTSTGTGVIISNNGIVLTNFHVIKELKDNWEWISTSEKNYQNNIKIPINNYNWKQIDFDIRYKNDIDLCNDSIKCKINNKLYNLKIIEANYKKDWAILKVEDSTFQTANFAILDTTNLSFGTEVYSLGFPISTYYGDDIKYTNGYISSNKQPELYSVNMGINPGNSGGGLFNKSNGQLIGLTTSRFDDNAIGVKVEGVSFSLKLNEIAYLLKNKKYLYLHFLNNDVPRNWSSIRHRYSDRKRRKLGNPKIKIKNQKFNPKITTESNANATIQIISD